MLDELQTSWAKGMDDDLNYAEISGNVGTDETHVKQGTKYDTIYAW